MSERAREAAMNLYAGIGRRDFVRAVAAVGAGAGVAGLASACSSGSSTPDGSPSATAGGFSVLQPGQGDPEGDHYLPSTPDEVLWGYVPTVHATPVMQMASGQTVTIDAVSHEGILEDQGRDPIEYFGTQGWTSRMFCRTPSPSRPTTTAPHGISTRTGRMW